MEQSEVISAIVDIHVDGVTIAIESTTITVTTPSDSLCDGDVGIQYGIDVIVSVSLIHHVTEGVPVCRTVDDEIAWEL